MQAAQKPTTAFLNRKEHDSSMLLLQSFRPVRAVLTDQLSRKPRGRAVPALPRPRSLYRKDGFLRATSMFDAKEMELLLAVVEADPAIAQNVMPMEDAGGRASKLALWFTLGDDLYQAPSRAQRRSCPRRRR